MNRKPGTASGYSGAAGQLAQAASLYVATKLGDLQDEIVIVGGLVPGLIIPQGEAPGGRPSHVGTMDVDLGLAIALLDQRRYHELAVRLQAAGRMQQVGPRTSDGVSTSTVAGRPSTS